MSATSVSSTRSSSLPEARALEAKLAEYPGDDDLANGETWMRET